MESTSRSGIRATAAEALAELQEHVDEGHTDKWAGAWGMWNAFDPCLEDVPGIENPGYGQ